MYLVQTLVHKIMGDKLPTNLNVRWSKRISPPRHHPPMGPPIAKSSNCAEANAALRRAVGGLKELDEARRSETPRGWCISVKSPGKIGKCPGKIDWSISIGKLDLIHLLAIEICSWGHVNFQGRVRHTNGENLLAIDQLWVRNAWLFGNGWVLQMGKFHNTDDLFVLTVWPFQISDYCQHLGCFFSESWVHT